LRRGSGESGSFAAAWFGVRSPGLGVIRLSAFAEDHGSAHGAPFLKMANDRHESRITVFNEPVVADRTREELLEEGKGLAFFENAVQYIRNHLL